jgi:hypothetical protein
MAYTIREEYFFLCWVYIESNIPGEYISRGVYFLRVYSKGYIYLSRISGEGRGLYFQKV